MATNLFLLSCLIGCVVALPFVADRDRSEELSGEFEGDIVLNQEQVMQRNGLKLTSRRWPKNVVPYSVSPDFNDEQVAYIRKGLDTLELASCLRFVERTTETDYVNVVNGTGCSSSVGYQKGRQTLTLASNTIENGCFRLATIMHEFLHALGFYHMQSTYNRDSFVIVAYENIEEGKEHNFNKYTIDTVTDFGIPYDYNSVMHYSTNGFSKNGLPTLVPKDPYASIGQRIALSRSDIEKLNLMYGCSING